MQIVKCDKCPAETTMDAVKGWSLVFYPESVAFFIGDKPKLDLCPKCYEAYQAILGEVIKIRENLIKEWLP